MSYFDTICTNKLGPIKIQAIIVNYLSVDFQTEYIMSSSPSIVVTALIAGVGGHKKEGVMLL
jgi:hypothetical protein